MKSLTLSIAVLATSVTFFLASCSKSGSNSNPAPTSTKPTITALSINTGPYTTLVTITGSGFSSVISDDKVFFNGVAATVISATTTQIKTSVPLAAGTGNVTVNINGTIAKGPLFTYQTSLVAYTLSGAINSPGKVPGFGNPYGLAVDKAGNIFAADRINNSIRKIASNGLTTTFAGSGVGASTDGNGTAASFFEPTGIAIDGTGNIFVTDAGSGLVRKITQDGTVTTILTNRPTKFAYALALTIDVSGNIFVVDQGSGSIIKITPAGITTTIYQFGGNFSPYGIAVDKNDNLFVTDKNANRIDKITQAGVISTFAGSGAIFGKSDGLGTAASFDAPDGIAIDFNENLFVTDQGTGLIRMITPDAVVTTLTPKDGDYFDGFNSVDNFFALHGIAIDANGNLFVINVNTVEKVSMQ